MVAVPDRAIATRELDARWGEVLRDDTIEAPPGIAELVNSRLVAIRYCLLTQVLGKLVQPDLDAMCLQRGSGGPGRWDPRSFAAAVVVPWNRANQHVLGRSGDPYVSNPLRRKRVDDGLDQMRDKPEWERLSAVLLDVEAGGNPGHTLAVFMQILAAVRDRLRGLTFSYVIPPRVSLMQAQRLAAGFLAERSGGERGLAVVAAVFETVRQRLGLYSSIRRGVVNAADAATNAAGDLECLGPDGGVILAVEVKERRIGDDDVRLAIAKAREVSVRELLFCTEGVNASDAVSVAGTFEQAWASGTSLYHVTTGELMQGVMPLLGEEGIRQFVVNVGLQLDAFTTQPRHRKAWKTMLDGL